MMLSKADMVLDKDVQPSTVSCISPRFEKAEKDYRFKEENCSRAKANGAKLARPEVDVLPDQVMKPYAASNVPPRSKRTGMDNNPERVKTSAAKTSASEPVRSNLMR